MVLGDIAVVLLTVVYGLISNYFFGNLCHERKNFQHNNDSFCGHRFLAFAVSKPSVLPC